MEEEGWENALDIDDSDLPTFPTLQPCSQLSRPAQPLSTSPPRQPRPPSPPPAEQEAAARATAPPPPRRIPGPAGAVQAAAKHRLAAAAAAALAQGRGDLRLEGERADRRRAFEDGGAEVDEDFLQNPWLCALDFVGGSENTSSISSIKALGSTDRVPKLMGIVTSCKPNGLGDLFVTLKDPTGTIGASIHRRVLMEGNFGGDLSVGCVLILKQVAVFSPMRPVVYLNVTLNNMDKLFAKDSGPPSSHIRPTLTAKCSAFEKILDDGMEPVGGARLLSQGSQRIAAVGSQRGLLVASRTPDTGNMEKRKCIQALDREVVQNIHCKRTVDGGQVEHLSGFSMCTEEAAIKSVGFGDALRPSLVGRGAGNIYNEGIIHNPNFKRRINDGSTETPSEELGNRMNITNAAISLGKDMLASPLNQEADRIATEQIRSSQNMDIDCGKDERTGSLHCKTSGTSASDSLFCKPPDKVVEPKRMISKVSVARWTDEQLSELFCDYQDDADFF